MNQHDNTAPLLADADDGIAAKGLPWLLVVAGALVYANSLANPFVFDDHGAIVVHARKLGVWPPRELLAAPPDSSFAGRPVVAFTIAVNHAFGGLDVRGYRAVNIAVHVCCAMALFGVVRRTLRQERLRDRFGRASTGLAMVCSLVWLVHPVQTECINYIAQRTESIMAFFYLLTMYCAIRATESDGSRWWCAAAIFSCALGMASKEVMVTAPVMVVLYDVAFGAGSVGFLLRRRVGWYAGLAATWLVLVVLMGTAPRGETVGFDAGIGAVQYALNQCVMIVEYLRVAVWPHALVLDYGVPLDLSVREILPFAIVLTPLLLLTFVAVCYRSPVGFLGAWFFIILSPTSSIVPITTEVGADRRIYLPLVGLVVLFVIGAYAGLDRLAAWVGKRDSPKTESARSRTVSFVGVTASVVLIIVLATVSVRRNQEYRSNAAIWQTVVERRPTNARAHASLGHALVRERRYDDAIRCFHQALELDRDDADLQLSIGDVYRSQGKPDLAKQRYRMALQMEPKFALACVKLARVDARRGDAAEALRRYRQALEIKPDYAAASLEMADLLVAADDINKAIALYRNAVVAEPKWPIPLIRLARILAMHPDASVRDGATALRLAQRAIALTNRSDPRVLSVLGAAYAETGDFANARAVTESALAQPAQRHDPKLARALQDQLDHYRDERPYRSSFPARGD